MILTLRGVLLLLVAVPVIALAAWAPLLEVLAGLYILGCLILLGLDWTLAGPVGRFAVVREHGERLSLGAENPIRLRVRNRSGRPVHLWVRDEPPEGLPVNRLLLCGSLQPWGEWEDTYTLRPLRRGDYCFGDIHLRWNGPLSLVLRQGQVQAGRAVKVYPNLLEVRRYDLLLRRNRLQEMGLRSSRVFGEGTEFDRLRDYLPDDEFRRIDWKATARHHRPVTTEYRTERSQNIIALLDTGRMMQSPVADMAKLDYAVNAVLLLAYVATGKGDRVGLMTFADQVGRFLSPRQGRGQFYRMLEVLYGVEAEPVEPDYRRALGYLALKQRRRALVVLFTDLTGGLSTDALVAHLAVLARRSLPLVVTISDPDLHRAAREVPTDSLSAYRRAAANRLLDERRVLLDRLRLRGVLVLDVPADRLSVAIINRYLELKGKLKV